MSDSGASIDDQDRLFDPISMEVFNNRLLSITEDMGNTLIRSSFSTNIKERRDCSVGLFDAQGRCACQASHLPMHLGSLWGSTQAVLERYSLDEIEDGDAFICNDVYLAHGTHLPDVTVVTPVFWDGRLRFFCANVGHHSDVGGRVPGSISGTNRTIFEEGIRIPVIRIVRAGKLDEDLLNLLVHNTREPEDRALDFRVQIATNERGKIMLQDLVRRSGIEAVERSIDDIIAYTRRRLRRRVSALEDGDYSCTRYLDDDGFEGDPVPLHVTVRIRGADLTIDLTGSGAQGRGGMNLPDSALRATAYYAVKTALDPELMPNSGLFDAVEVMAPSGTITNPDFPAAVGARSITANKVAGAMLGAFYTLLPPERVMAGGHDSVPAIVFSGQRPDGRGTYVYLETIGGGVGAAHDHDGMDAVQMHISNTSNLPVESLEHEYDLLVDEYALVEDSGGAGKYDGGLGIARQIRAMRDGINFTARADGHVIAATGVFGGGDGGRARLIKNHGTPTAEALHSKASHIELQAGESVRMETAGGAGYGAPGERDTASLAADIRGGKVSRTAAERTYGAERVAEALSDGDR
ncbi:MAG: hydantoinase B/oxoprolinase family protein [Alphaproteobacteria bacterium]|nr:hydantoinase B/oxoprolinase family protein [Alphaproteobacteria bacterium]